MSQTTTSRHVGSISTFANISAFTSPPKLRSFDSVYKNAHHITTLTLQHIKFRDTQPIFDIALINI